MVRSRGNHLNHEEIAHLYLWLEEGVEKNVIAKRLGITTRSVQVWDSRIASGEIVRVRPRKRLFSVAPKSPEAIPTPTMPIAALDGPFIRPLSKARLMAGKA